VYVDSTVRNEITYLYIVEAVKGLSVTLRYFFKNILNLIIKNIDSSIFFSLVMF